MLDMTLNFSFHLPLSPRKVFKPYKAQTSNMFQQSPVSSLLFLFWLCFNNPPQLQVMTVGPFLPVLSWIWDIFSAIAIRGLSTAWRGRNEMNYIQQKYQETRYLNSYHSSDFLILCHSSKSLNNHWRVDALMPHRVLDSSVVPSKFCEVSHSLYLHYASKRNQ